MEEEEIPSPIVDFGKKFLEAQEKGIKFDPTALAQAMSEIKKEKTGFGIEFSKESLEAIKKAYGDEVADNAQQIYRDSIETMESGDSFEYFKPIALDTFENRQKGLQTAEAPRNRDQVDPIFSSHDFFKPTQYRTYQEIAEENRMFFDVNDNGEIEKKKLKDTESFSDIANPFGIGFGGSNLVVATNGFVAEADPEIKRRIDEGELHADDYYRDEEDKFVYRKKRKGEELFDDVRSIFGPKSVYNQSFLAEAGKGVYDGVIALVEGAGTLDYYGRKYLLGGFLWDDGSIDKSFNDFMANTSRLKATSSMERDRGWSHNMTNFTNLVANGVGQILGTMGTGVLVNAGMKGISAMSAAARAGKVSQWMMADVGGATTRALNFGIAAKAGKEESMRHGVSVGESDLIGFLAGSFMVAAEFMTGSQFIPKLTGRESYKVGAQNLSRHLREQANAQGITVQQLIQNNPGKIKSAIMKAHHWLESPASGAMSGAAKGFTGEAIQETTEDFMNALVKDGYDYLTGSKTFDQDWDEVRHDLAGSFWVGGAAGGVTKSVTSIGGKEYKRDQVDEKRNSIFVNKVVEGKTDELLKAVDYFEKKGMASKLFSINRDDNGNKQTVKDDKSLDSMSENTFFANMFRQQILFAQKAHQALNLKYKDKQKLADEIYKQMGQNSFTKIDNISELAKGVNQAMEIEGLQVYREESLLNGQLVLEAAKSMNTVTKIDSIEEVRIFGNKVMAVKREGEEDFSAPTVGEQTVLDQSIKEMFLGGDKGKGLFEQAKNVLELIRLENDAIFREERLQTGNPDPILMQESSAQLLKIQKELKEERTNLVELLKSNGMSETMADTLTDIQMVRDFKGTLQDGTRTKRYVRNFALQLAKEGNIKLFESRPDYNIEDFDYDRKRNLYFNESNDFESETVLKATEETKAFLDEAIQSKDESLVLEAISQILSDPRRPIDKATLEKINEIGKNYGNSLTDAQINGIYDYFSTLMVLDRVFASPQDFQWEAESIDDIISDRKETDRKQIDAFILSFDSQRFVQIQDAFISKFPDEFDESHAELINELLSQLPEMKDMHRVYQIGLQQDMVVKRIGDKRVSESIGQETEPLADFVKNMNIKFHDNFLPGRSELESFLTELEANPDFKDTGELTEIHEELSSNGRYLIGRLTEAIGQNDFEGMVSIQDMLKSISEIETRIDDLRLVSDRNRGDRFTRDYENSMDYVANRLTYLKKLNGILGMGIDEQLQSIDLTVVPVEDNRDLVHAELVKMINIEDEVADQFSQLSEADIEKVFIQFGFAQLEKDKGNLFEYLYKKVTVDNDNPFNPMDSRDMAESAMNFLLMLSRGNTKDFFTFGKDYFQQISNNKQFDQNVPSREQLLIARSLFSKLAADERSNLEVFLEKRNNYSKTSFETNFSAETIFLRGAGGTGKSTMAMNTAFDVLSKFREHNGLETNIAFSAPNAEQIANVGASLTGIGGKTKAVAFKVGMNHEFHKNLKDGKALGASFIVIDEATLFSIELNGLMTAVHEYNRKNVNRIKVVLSGDELQKSGKGRSKNFMYEPKAFKYAFERTVPLTTPFRSGKIDSFDVQSNTRKELISLSVFNDVKIGESYKLPGTNEQIVISNEDKINEVFQDLLKKFGFKKTTKFIEEDGIIKKGIKSVKTHEEAVSLFVEHLAKSDSDQMEQLVFVTVDRNVDSVIKKVQDALASKGVDMAGINFKEVIRAAEDIQGLTRDFVYTDIIPDKGGIFDAYISDMKALYVAQSREKQALVMVDPEQKITSSKVTLESEIISFPDLDYSIVDAQNKPAGDSLALIENNRHIATLVDDLASEKTVLNPKEKLDEKEESEENQSDDDSSRSKEEEPAGSKLDPKKTKDDMTDEEIEAINAQIKNPATFEEMENIASRPFSEMEKDAESFDYSKFENICE